MAQQLAWRPEAELRAGHVLLRCVPLVHVHLGRKWVHLIGFRATDGLSPAVLLVFLDQILFPNLPVIVILIGYNASSGATLFLALCSDLLSLSTLHLYLFYSMATTVFSFHTSAMRSLFDIFRGKKRNTIRNRVEPATYNLDQLLIGAVLFTLAAFLLPTVLAFYLVFAAVGV